MLPEREVGPDAEILAETLLRALRVRWIKEDITGALEGLGCYRQRDEAIRRVIPDYGQGWSFRIVLGHNPLEGQGFNIFFLEAFSPRGGQPLRLRLPVAEYLDIVAATNMKQRSRMIMQYYHAERLNYAVLGTHNRTEYDLGFMVRHGDIGVDLHPLAGLFKVQIYQLAAYLGVPEAITLRAPSSGTFPAPQTEQEFFFSLPFDLLDPLLHAEASGIAVEEAARALGIPVDGAERVYRDIRSKRRFSQYMRREPPVLNVVNHPKSALV
jgi:NAD+ synthase